jgi:hypothetical protein
MASQWRYADGSRCPRHRSLVVHTVMLVMTALPAGMLERFVRVSVGLPAAYSFSVLMLASLFFSSVSFVLLQEGKLALAPGSSPDVTLASLSDFFLWHFLDAVPLLKIPERLKWDVPLTYTSGTVGLIVLMFKVVVILPVIGAFTWYATGETGKQVPEVYA